MKPAFFRKPQVAAPAPEVTGLILSGGGARAAYQAGVLQAVARLLPTDADNPFQIISGTSAGAINAVSLACGAMDFARATGRLAEVWCGFSTGQVYRSDWSGVLRHAGRFAWSHILGMGSRQMPPALLDNSPLCQLLEQELDFAGISLALARRKLKAVAVTAFAYGSARSTTFYQSRGALLPWQRHNRQGVPVRLGVEHLMASAAIPLLFAPVRLGQEYYGDGAVRQLAPVSPALHMGANRILVVGVEGQQEQLQPAEPVPPSLAQISGHLLDSTFTDNLDADLELLCRLNNLGRLLDPQHHYEQVGLAPVEVLVIQPSQSIGEIALKHRRSLPRAIGSFLRGSGSLRHSGGILSYLLFEQDYCSELVELGYQDAMAQKDELCAFLRCPRVEIA